MFDIYISYLDLAICSGPAACNPILTSHKSKFMVTSMDCKLETTRDLATLIPPHINFASIICRKQEKTSAKIATVFTSPDACIIKPGEHALPSAASVIRE
jgi:hypothetical protein